MMNSVYNDCMINQLAIQVACADVWWSYQSRQMLREFLFIRLNHNTGRSAAMLLETQNMLQKNLYTVALLTFGVLIANRGHFNIWPRAFMERSWGYKLYKTVCREMNSTGGMDVYCSNDGSSVVSWNSLEHMKWRTSTVKSFSGGTPRLWTSLALAWIKVWEKEKQKNFELWPSSSHQRSPSPAEDSFTQTQPHSCFHLKLTLSEQGMKVHMVVTPTGWTCTWS